METEDAWAGLSVVAPGPESPGEIPDCPLLHSPFQVLLPEEDGPDLVSGSISFHVSLGAQPGPLKLSVCMCGAFGPRFCQIVFGLK